MRRLIKANAFQGLAIVILILVFFLLGTFRLDTFPPLWWDEGWTLNVARNWVEFGHYGQMRNGELYGPGLSAAFPVVAPIALSFKLFGVGIWQGRLPGLFFTLGTLMLMSYIVQVLYNRKIALGTLVVLIFLQGHVGLNPLLLGRQVLAELPMMFYLLVGYVFFLLSLRRSAWFFLPVVLFWGIALRTKAQLLPFWLISLLIPLLISVYKKWRKEGFVTVLCIAGSWLVQSFIPVLENTLVGGLIADSDPVDGLFFVTGFVLDPNVRIKALLTILLLGWTTMIGLSTSGYEIFRSLRNQSLTPWKYILNLSLFSLAGSWFVWYLLFGSYWQRYFFPASFLGGIYVAVLLFNLTSGFNVGKVVMSLTGPFRSYKLSTNSVWAGLAMLIIGFGLAISYLIFPKEQLISEDTSVEQVEKYFSSQVSTAALVESYDSELFFVLEQTFHYPPNQMHVDFNRQTLFSEESALIYDPLTIDPDYLIVGPFSNMWRVYDHVITNDQFELVLNTNRYQV